MKNVCVQMERSGVFSALPFHGTFRRSTRNDFDFSEPQLDENERKTLERSKMAFWNGRSPVPPPRFLERGRWNDWNGATEMALFTFDDTRPKGDPTSDQCATAMFASEACCAVCGAWLSNGQRGWYYTFGAATVVAHVECIKPYARGVILDFAGMMK